MRTAYLPLTALLMLTLVPSFAMSEDTSARVSEAITQQDAANIQLVKAFVAASGNAEHGASYLAPNASVRMASTDQPLVGREAYLGGWPPFPPGSSVSAKFHDVYARNPLVVAFHTVTIKIAGKPPLVLEVVGVFAVKGGKITEWTDYERRVDGPNRDVDRRPQKAR